MNTLTSHGPEEELVARAQKGDLDAYSELVRRYRETIYRTIFRYTKNHSDTDDLAQETFLRAFRGLKHFKRQAGFSTWVFRIAVNQSLNFLKKRKREKQMRPVEERTIGEEAASISSPDSNMGFHELGEKLDEAIDSLPLLYRSTFILVVLEGMNHRQAARVLGCSENTVAWRVHKARKMLQAKLGSYLGESRDEL